MTRLHRFIAAACSVLILAAVQWTIHAATRGPDAGGYRGTDSVAFSFIDIASGSGGASILSGTDDGAAALTLPFAFRFYGRPYTLVCVSANGAIYFVATDAACTPLANDFANTDLSLAGVPDDLPALLPLWSDLTFQVPGGGAVFYQTVGSAGNRKFIVQWNNAYPQGSPNPVTFQAILSEGGSITFQYKTVDLGHGNAASNGSQASVGIRNAHGLTDEQQIAWSYNVPVIHDNSALLFTGDSTGPTISGIANPAAIWPPDGKPINVMIAGSVVDVDSGVDATSLNYSVSDEYAQVQPRGTFSLTATGDYSFAVPLIAARLGSDQDGRTYRITINARDRNGNASSRTLTVRVPHDQGK